MTRTMTWKTQRQPHGILSRPNPLDLSRCGRSRRLDHEQGQKTALNLRLLQLL